MLGIVVPLSRDVQLVPALCASHAASSRASRRHSECACVEVFHHEAATQIFMLGLHFLTIEYNKNLIILYCSFYYNSDVWTARRFGMSGKLSSILKLMSFDVWMRVSGKNRCISSPVATPIQNSGGCSYWIGL
jgi:hypothetical protein